VGHSVDLYCTLWPYVIFCFSLLCFVFFFFSRKITRHNGQYNRITTKFSTELAKFFNVFFTKLGFA
jgi:hypothetical protein